MPDDLNPMSHRRDPMALLRFAVREGDLRLVELLAGALRRDDGVATAGAPVATAASTPPRSPGPPSPLARRTLDALLILLALDEPSRRRREGDE